MLQTIKNTGVLCQKSKLFCCVLTLGTAISAISVVYISTMTSTNAVASDASNNYNSRTPGLKNGVIVQVLHDNKGLDDQSFTSSLNNEMRLADVTAHTSTNSRSSRGSRSMCNGEPVDIIICVHSHPKNAALRDMIRQTWANQGVWVKFRVKTMFFIGRPVKPNATESESVQLDIELYKAVIEESRSKSDVILGDFMDTYRNLTMKTLTALKWVTDYCAGSTYYIKVDDDVIVNAFQVQQMLSMTSATAAAARANGNANALEADEIACCYFRNLAVKRNRSESKWFVTEKELPINITVYPPFCSGMGYIMRTETALKLYKASFFEPFLWIDDIYVTGFLAQRINATFRRLNVAWDTASTREAFSKKTWQDNTFGHGVKTPLVLRKIWFRLALIVGKKDMSILDFIRAMVRLKK